MTNFQKWIANTRETRVFSHLYQSFNSVYVFVYLTLSGRCNNIFGNISFLRSDTYPPVLILCSIEHTTDNKVIFSHCLEFQVISLLK